MSLDWVSELARGVIYLRSGDFNCSVLYNLLQFDIHFTHPIFRTGGTSLKLDMQGEMPLNQVSGQ